jgi:peptidoglycan hydrolase-like protein with peptidoglycan-binding domain
MRKKIIITEAQFHLILEQGFMLGAGNKFVGNFLTNGLKSTGQSLKIDKVDGDKVTITNLSNPSDRNIEGVKDLSSDRSGKTYKRTDGKGYFTFVSKKLNEQLANAKVTNKPTYEIPNFMTMPNGVELVQRALIKKGYSVGVKGADGVLGPNTKNAIIKYQKDNGIKQTGIVGPITAKSLGVQSLTSGKPLATTPTTTKKLPINLNPKAPSQKSKIDTSLGISKVDTNNPIVAKSEIGRQMGQNVLEKMKQFTKGIVPVKKDSQIAPHLRIYTDFLRTRTSPITTNDFTSEELKTILNFIKNSKVGNQSKNVDFSSAINFSNVKSGKESQIKPDMQKAIGYVLGNAQVKDMGNYYSVTDIYDFNNYKNHPENYTLEKTPSTVKNAVLKLWNGNYVQGLEELSSYYQKFGYEGIPVSLQIPKNLA